MEYIGPSVDGRPFGQATPVPQQVYTVRENGVVLDIPAIKLFEIVNPARDWGNGFYEMWMNRDWFRPLDERETEISIFTAMLDKAPVTA